MLSYLRSLFLIRQTGRDQPDDKAMAHRGSAGAISVCIGAGDAHNRFRKASAQSRQLTTCETHQ